MGSSSVWCDVGGVFSDTCEFFKWVCHMPLWCVWVFDVGGCGSEN